MPEKRRLSLSFSLAQREQRELLEAVRRIIREELAGVSFPKTTTQQEQAGAVDEDVLGFLRALQEGDEIT